MGTKGASHSHMEQMSPGQSQELRSSRRATEESIALQTGCLQGDFVHSSNESMVVHEPVVVITCRTPEYIQLKENMMLPTKCSGMLENRTLGGFTVVGAVSQPWVWQVHLLFWPDHVISVETKLRQGSICMRQADPECVRSVFLAIPKKTGWGKEVGGGEDIKCH